MKNYCIPKDLIEKLKPRMKNMGGSKLMSMSSKELSDFFSETVGDKLGLEVAKSFRKASLSHKQNAMKMWAKKVLTPQEAKAVEEQANELTEEDEVYKDIDGDVIEKALGVEISVEEIDKINELAKAMQEAEKLTPNEFTGVSDEYFEASKKMNDYLDTVNPMSKTELASMIIFRGNLLFGVKSIVTNVVGNTFGGISEKIVNTILNRKAIGVNSDLIKPYVKTALKIYNDTGMDVVRAMELNDSSTILGEHFKGVGNGTGFVRGYARFIEQYVLRMGQGTPDIVFASTHFADNVNVLTTAIAGQKGLTGDALKAEARRLFKLATSLTLDPNNPDHAEAYGIKQTAVQYAMTATYQNNTAWSKRVLEIRNSIDDYTGALKLGTNTTPFVKTLVNIAKLSLDMTGLTMPIELMRMQKAYKNGDVAELKKGINVSIRAGLGVTLAMLLASALDDDEYIPDYLLATSQQKEIAKLQNAPYNSIRIGDKWVSLGYFGTFGYVLSGMLSAKKEQNLSDKAMAYAFDGGVYQLRNTPLIQQLMGLFDYVNETKEYNKSGGDIMREAVSGTAGFFTSRLVPAIVSDIGKSFDDKERFTRFGFDGIVDQLQVKIPFWREVLPPKYNALGDEIPTEAFYWTILTGARLKTALTDTELVKELNSLSKSGSDVTLKLDAYKDVKTAKEILNDVEFNQIKAELGKELSNAYANIMGTQKYKKEADPEKKKKLLYDTREQVVDRVFKKAGLKSRIEKFQKGEKGTGSSSDNANRGMVELAMDYAKAYNTDPENAFKAMFTSEQLGRVKGNLVELERFKGVDYNAKGGSEEYMRNLLEKAGIPYKDRSKYNLEHITPVKAGGGTDADNLYVVERDLHKSYTQVDVLASELIQDGKVERKEVSDIMKKLKVQKTITIEQAKEMLKAL